MTDKYFIEKNAFGEVIGVYPLDEMPEVAKVAPVDAPKVSKKSAKKVTPNVED